MIEEESLIWIMIILVISTLLIIGMSYNSYDKVISKESSCHIRLKNSNLSSENLSAHAIPVYGVNGVKLHMSTNVDEL